MKVWEKHIKLKKMMNEHNLFKYFNILVFPSTPIVRVIDDFVLSI